MDKPNTTLLEIPSDIFVRYATIQLSCDVAKSQNYRKIDLYNGARVTIIVKTGGHKKIYKLSKALLMDASPYFTAAFNGNFKEGVEQTLELDCTVAAFDMVVQHVYTGHSNLRAGLTPLDKITDLLDFTILMNMLLMRSESADNKVAELLREILRTGIVIDREHVRKAVQELPSGHEIRKMFASATILEFLLSYTSPGKPDDFKFNQEYKDLEGYAADLLNAFMGIRHTRTGSTVYFDYVTD